MASRLNPYLTFDGNAREAMEFYRGVFGGELTVSTFADMGTEGPDADKVMHAMLETPEGYTLMGADTPQGMEYTPGTTAISISGDDADLLRGYFAKLSESGQVTMPLEKQMWGDEFGMCADKFGQAWMVDIYGEAVSG